MIWILRKRLKHAGGKLAKGRRRKKGLGDSTRRRGERNKSDIFISTRVSSVARVRHRASASINIRRPGFLSSVRTRVEQTLFARAVQDICDSPRKKCHFLGKGLHNFAKNKSDIVDMIESDTIAKLQRHVWRD